MAGNPPASRLAFGTVTVVPDERLVLKDGQPVALTPKAFDLLAVLAANPGRLLTKEHLMQAVWPDTVVEEANLSYHVFAIRKALGENDDGDRYIETVPKRGYRFVAPVVRVDGNGGGPQETTKSAAEVQLGLQPEQATTAAQAAAVEQSRLTSSSGSDKWGRWSLGLACGIAIGALAVLVAVRDRRPPAATTPTRFQEPVTRRLAETGTFSISPDGRRLVYAAEGTDGVLQLWLRAMSAPEPVPLPGTEVFEIIPPMVWSPDSRDVAFDATGSGALKKVGVDGGAPQSVCEAPSTAVGGTWNRDGALLLGNAFGGLVLCHAAGGAASIVTLADQSVQERHILPSFLSDGRHFLYLLIARTKPERSGIYVGELGSTPTSPGRRLLTTGFNAVFVPAVDGGPGFIVFGRDGALFAQRFDEQRLEMVGEPTRVADRIGSFLDFAFFAVSSKTLVYRAPEPDSQITWFDRQGRELGRVGQPARINSLAVSPHGNRLLLAVHSPQNTMDQDLWLYDVAQAANPRKMTFEPMIEMWPVWSTDDQFVYGSGGGASGVYQQSIGGHRRLMFKTGGNEWPTSITSDERILLFTAAAETGTGVDIWVRVGEGASAIVKPFLLREKDQTQAQLSPDGHWVAYVSNEGGPNDVFVAEFRVDRSGSATAGDSVRISQGGGFAPRWRRDGQELYYLRPDGSVMAVEVEPTREFRASAARRLFRVPGVFPEWGVTPDGGRFLFAVPVSLSPPFNVVQDWQALARK